MKPSTFNRNSYEHWTKEELIARLVDLDDRIRVAYPNAKDAPQKPTHQKTFNFSAYPVRKIAIKFCYSGWEYNGLAFQKTPTPLPTVEEVLFQAFAKTRLIDPDAGYDGCGWERCGRTDRGVSAAGQVISLWVRSAAQRQADIAAVRSVEDEEPPLKFESDAEASKVEDTVHSIVTDASSSAEAADGSPELPLNAPKKSFVHPQTDLHYVQLLNRVLPPTIRVIAWSPVASSFSARFNCRQRHYKYFFSSNGLDLSLMRDGAQRLIGEHDFRNFCKLDPAKQITSFYRRILDAEINPVADAKDLFVLDLVGTAFLYHQVRHIMAVLFLVGSGLEHPSVISFLLNVNPETQTSPPLTKDGDPPLEVVDRKPAYQMADGLPLLLWDCGFTDSDLQWRAGPNDSGKEKGGSGSELHDQFHAIYARSVIHTILDAHFVKASISYHPPAPIYLPRSKYRTPLPSVIQVPLGGGTYNRNGNYTPLLRRKWLESVEVVNERWKAGKGERKQDKRQLGTHKAYVDE